ncbi:hypothetical protein [Streptomyces candidus]|uniref:Uncharacterized protein n=1 Tax=Streptomyces candidus TaxID=67283 RepID=A0A7X0HN86_9ACTN|nr:hypothetical protein [Streptomyces candidus]MBB6439477.1 hypothetical protein [Streptomyces candidus]GHH56514.1 hypothetical protein GCM10018773_62580 [Streptomyces candidus]
MTAARCDVAPPALHLVLPEADLPSSGAECPSSCGAALERQWRTSEWVMLTRQAEHGKPLIGFPSPRQPADLAWHRWLVGHQVTFLEWSLLRDVLTHEQSAPAEEVVRLLDLYSALLLYAGSCSPALYHHIVRPRMAQAHPAFSGEWARDYQGLPRLLKRAADAGPPAMAQAARRNHRVHAAVAAHLVPEGASLLQQAGRGAGEEPSQQEADLYDRFFLSRRGPVCRHALKAQLLPRLLWVIADLESRGLYYASPPLSQQALPTAREHLVQTEETIQTRLRQQAVQLAYSLESNTAQP